MNYFNFIAIWTSFIFHLDECYYGLFYCVDVSNRSQSRVPTIEIPSPADYFGKFALDISILLSEFQKFLTHNFSEEAKVNIRRIWGTETDLSLHLSTTLTNPLLYLHYLRWCESLVWLSLCITPRDIPTLLSACRLAPVTNGDTINVTMKGRDPLMPEKLRVWCDSCRIWPCHLYSFATPSITSIRKLVELSPLVEIGAGTGYWSHMIRQAGGIVHCYDRDPPSAVAACKANSYHGRTKQWTAVLRGGPEKSTQHGSSASLFLCYPPPDNDMALAALRAFKGNTLCYVGEFSGDTGTRSFEKLLVASFVCCEILSLPNWADTCYSLMIWRRKTSNNSANNDVGEQRTNPFRCSTCGLSRSQMNRCRLTYNIYFCDIQCAARGKTIHFEELVMRSLVCKNYATNLKSHSTERIAAGCNTDGGLSKKRKRDAQEDTKDSSGELCPESVASNQSVSDINSSEINSLDIVNCHAEQSETHDTLIPFNMSYLKKVHTN